MLTMKDPEVFNDFGPHPLVPKAVGMMLKALDDVRRFIGNPMVTEEYSESTAAHTERTFKTGAEKIREAIPDAAYAQTLIYEFKTVIAVHDFPEVILEPITAHAETDPARKQELAKKHSAYERHTAFWFYKLALFSLENKDPDLFYQTLAEIRQAVVPKNYEKGNLPANDLEKFYAMAQFIMDQREQEFQKSPKWNYNSLNEKAAVMLTYFDRIENETTFIGKFAKIWEKADGTAFANSVSNKKSCEGKGPTNYHHPGYRVMRPFTRYEKGLEGLILSAHAGTNGEQPHFTALAVQTAYHAYGISIDALSSAKAVLTRNVTQDEPLEEDPQGHHERFVTDNLKAAEDGTDPNLVLRDTVIAMYQEARELLGKKELATLPENGSCIAMSKTVRKINPQTLTYV